MGKEKKCPHCAVSMGFKEFDGRLTHPDTGALLRVRMDQCPKCEGMWFDCHEIETTMGLGRGLKGLSVRDRLVNCDACGAELKPHWLECGSCKNPSTLACPACTGRLYKLLVLGVQLDQCSVCDGLWCDGGELHQLHAKVRARRFELGGDAKYTRCLGCNTILSVRGPESRMQRCVECQRGMRETPFGHGPDFAVSGVASDALGVVGAAGEIAELAFAIFSLVDFD